MAVVPKSGVLALATAWLLSGCSSEGSGPGEQHPGALRMAIDAAIPAASEEYVCRYLVIPDGGFDVAGFEQRLDPHSHHLLLWQTTLQPSDVEARLDTVIRRCDGDVASHAAISGMLYGAQPGNASLRYSPGAALRLAPGAVVLLEHHVVNAGQSELSTHAEIDLVPSDGPVRAEAGLFHFYDWAIHVPPRSSSRSRMRCTIAEPLELMFVHGHMHERGTEFRASVDRAGESLPLLHSAAWNEPTQRLSPPLALWAGDAVEFECSYDNPDAIEVAQGTSAREDEMCSLTAGYVAQSGKRLNAFAESCALRGSGVIGHGSLDCAGIEDCISAAIALAPGSVDAARQAQSCFLEGCPAKTIPFLDLTICRVERCAEPCNPTLDSAGFVARPADEAACTACIALNCETHAAACASSNCAD
jgi:hypothetical protein